MNYKATLIGTILGALLSLSAHGANANTKVGITSAVNPQATGTPLGGAPRTLILGKKIFYNERIKTSSDGMVQLLLLDGSAFTIGPNSELRIDKFIYDPRKKTGEMVANFVKGAFRFVGGRLSKNKGGVTIHTSIATLGVRGGVVSGRVDPRGREGNFNFLFGDQMSIGTNCQGGAITSCKHVKRVFQNGNTVHVIPGGKLDLKRTTRRDIAGIQHMLAGKKGRNGGVRRPPTGQMVARSGIGHQNSARHPTTNAPPSRSAIQATPVVEVETVVTNPAAATGDKTREDITESNLENRREVRGRILESSDSYTINSSPPLTLPEAWRVGLLGGTELTDYSAFGVIENGRLRDGEYLSGGNLPWRTGHFEITDGVDGAGGTLTGRGYVSPDETFFFYEVENNNDPANNDAAAMLIFGGSAPTNLTAHGNLRTYAIQRDMFQDSKIPFTLANIMGPETLAVVSPFFLKEQASGTIGIYPTGSTSRTVSLQASLMIDGIGRGQRSHVMVHAGTVFDTGDGNGPRISTALRGSVRSIGFLPIATFSGQVETLQGPDGNFFFSDNMEDFIIGNDPRHNDSFHMSAGLIAPSADYSDPSTTFILPQVHYGTTHLATLTSTTNAAALPAQTSRIMNGFAAGFMEQSGAYPGIFTVLSSGNVANTEILFNASTNGLRANLVLENYGSPHISGYTLAFGSDPSRVGEGHSAFVDNDTYAAQHNQDGTLIHFSSGSVQGFPSNLAGTTPPETYFLGNELVPTTNFAPGVNFCACKFLEWGYWGGRMEYENPTYPGIKIRDLAHLNTWVSGVVTKSGNWPTSGIATYAGHAIANVLNMTPGSEGRYLAAGNFNMNWDFSSRTGHASITGFDGRTINAPHLFQSSSPTPDTFEGSLTNGGNGSGKIIGAFAAGPGSPVQGAIGQFEFNDTDYKAVGNIISEKTN